MDRDGRGKGDVRHCNRRTDHCRYIVIESHFARPPGPCDAAGRGTVLAAANAQHHALGVCFRRNGIHPLLVDVDDHALVGCLRTDRGQFLRLDRAKCLCGSPKQVNAPIIIWIDPVKLSSYGVTVAEVRAALDKQNVELPSGKLTGENTELTVKTLGNLSTEKEFNNIIIVAEGDKTVRLSDIGRAELGS